jgi:hypothetical protein
MDVDFDYNLTADQWEALKALRLTAAARGRINPGGLEHLVALDLALINDGLPCITPLGRKVLIRGSSSLLDVAA